MTKNRWIKYIDYIKKNFNFNNIENEIEVIINNIYIYIYELKWEIKNYKNIHRKNCLDLSKEENWSVLILFLKLINKGYKLSEIHLEKPFKLGHKDGYLDVAIYNNEKPFAFIEVKRMDEYRKYINVLNHQEKSKQLFSYIQQDKNVQICSYYSFDPSLEKDFFSTIMIDDNLRKSNSINDLFDKWNKVWEENNILNWEKFRISFSPIKYSDLRELTRETIKIIFNQFLTILRQYSVSDKSNAFDKLINIFLVKVIDERNYKSDFIVNGYEVKESLKFQFIENIDTNISFIKRLNDLYKDGMKEFMDKDIIDYKDSEIEKLMNSKNDFTNSKLMKIFDDLRLKKNNAFAFIEVFDDKTFEQNSLILKEIVCLFQKYKFKYSSKYQYLGDFFEELLNTSWKQEAGQFFTPMPIVDFMIKSLPIKEQMEKNIKNNKLDFLPRMIDNACGSGHFLISFMDEVQNFINDYEDLKNPTIKNKIEAWRINSYSWAKDIIIGIEKDYRLAKTTKISGFLNGDGEATIINGDGINKFSSEEYRNTILYSQQNKIEKFDFFITNPPFSVDGFLKNILINNINEKDFCLLKSLPKTSSRIEILFVERMYQLLKEDGLAVIILPQSIFTTKDYVDMRNFMFNKFEILSICNFGDITFSGTTTSPTILFLRKRKKDEESNFDNKVLIVNSPKMIKKSSKEEKEFLGYEFSSNRNKLGINYINGNLKNSYSPIIKDWIINKRSNDIKENELIQIRQLVDIIIDIDNEKMIYPNKKPRPNKNWKTLFELGFTINDKAIKIDEINDIKYIEIGDIENSKINIKSNKIKQSKKICLYGDILFSSLTPSKEKVAISDGSYYVSDAIFIIKHEDSKLINWLFNYFMKNKNIFNDINSILDGFKITYSKISTNNLLNNVYFDISELN